MKKYRVVYRVLRKGMTLKQGYVDQKAKTITEATVRTVKQQQTKNPKGCLIRIERADSL